MWLSLSLRPFSTNKNQSAQPKRERERMSDEQRDNEQDRERGEREGEQQGEESDVQTNWDEVISSFDDMDLKEDLLRGIYAYGFEKPSAIQQVIQKLS